MIPLHRDPVFTFRFADARLTDRVHLDEVPPGTPVTLTTPNGAVTLRRAVAGDGGWVPVEPPLVVAAGGGFVARPDPPPYHTRHAPSPPGPPR